MNENQLFTVCLSSVSTITVTVIGSYMQMLQPVFVVIALVANLLGGFIIALIVSPYELVSEEEDFQQKKQAEISLFEVINEYMMLGFQIAINVAIMIVGFVGLIAFIDASFQLILGIRFQELLGYLFAPLAFIMGIPWKDSIQSGGIIATKILTNEFVAIETMQGFAGQLSSKTEAILSSFVLSFANFSTIGLTVGVINGLNKKAGRKVAKFALRLLLAATLVSILNASIVGMFF